jgi:hypothetical protein
MANQYSDLFTYESLAFSKSDVVYSNVTLLKDMCAKKANVTLDEIRLDTRTGKFTVPRRKSTRVEETTAAKTLVEFKGKHTRFPDSDDEKDILFYCANPKEWTKKLEDKSAVFEKGESSSRPRPNSISGMIGLRIYENKRRKLLRVGSVDDLLARKIDEHFRKEMRAVNSDITMGPRGDLTFTFQTSSMECIPEMKTLTEFIVDGCTYYYMRLV